MFIYEKTSLFFFQENIEHILTVRTYIFEVLKKDVSEAERSIRQQVKRLENLRKGTV